MKQLSIAVPSYNSAAFLHKGLESYIYPDGTIDPRLEVIIVNDGSTDSTIEVANEWADRFPGNIVVVDKENGGHGSGINAGIDKATGRYYKVIDSDDWILTENLDSILNELEKTKADIVLTGYHTVNGASGVNLPYGTGTDAITCGEKASDAGSRLISMEDLAKNCRSIPASQSFHGIMYNSEFYRNTGIRMSEKVFFEDQEYAILPFAHADSVLLLPYFMYEYQIGSANQSVNFANQARRSADFLKVFRKMADYHLNHTDMTSAQNEFFIWRLSHSAVSYYATVLVKSPDKADGREKAGEFRSWLSEHEPEVAERTSGKYKTMLRLNKSKAASKIYAALFNSKLYNKFKKIWIR